MGSVVSKSISSICRSSHSGESMIKRVSTDLGEDGVCEAVRFVQLLVKSVGCSVHDFVIFLFFFLFLLFKKWLHLFFLVCFLSHFFLFEVLLVLELFFLLVCFKEFFFRFLLSLFLLLLFDSFKTGFFSSSFGVCDLLFFSQLGVKLRLNCIFLGCYLL